MLSCDTTFFQVQVTLGAWDDLLRECRAKLINILCIFTYFSAVGLRGSGLLTIDIHPAWDKGYPLKPLNRACLEQEITPEISLVIDYPRIPPPYNLLHIHPGQCQSGNHHYLMEKAYDTIDTHRHFLIRFVLKDTHAWEHPLESPSDAISVFILNLN